MMHPATYLKPSTVAAALEALGTAGAVALGGGTDLVGQMHDEVVRPAVLVDLQALPGARDILLHDDGSATLGAAVPLADLAAHEGARTRYPALAAAAHDVGSPQLRHQGTLGGNLCQRPRCWYFRRGVGDCLKRGGTGCAARDGEHQYHAAFDRGPCWAVHPSDPAVALAALEAEVAITGPAGTRRIPVADLYAPAAHDPTRETVVAPGEFVAAVHLPSSAAGGTQAYEKTMQRGAWDFALVSLAAHKRTDGEVRLVFGGLAAGPWRVNDSIEEDISVGGLDDESIDALAERAMYDATPLPGTAYKVAIAQALLRQAARLLDPR